MKRQEHLTPREAAQHLSVRLDSVYSLIWAGKLAARKQDGRWLIPSRSVEERAKKREARNG